MKIVFITGPSGSGKTTISHYISNYLVDSYVLSTDNYYKTGFISNIFSNIIKSYFDKIISHKQNLLKQDINYIFKNKSINHYYKYDFINKVNKKYLKNISNIQILIVEGIFSLELTDLFEENQYVLVRLKAEKNICRERVLKRDHKERGKNKNLSLNEFNNGWNIYQKKEKEYNSKISKGITIKKSIDFDLLMKKLSKKI